MAGALLALLLGTLMPPGGASAHEQASGAAIVRNVVALHPGDPVPDAELIDQNGRPFRFASLRGKTVVLSFMYIRCPDPRECPLISANFHTLQEKFGNGPYALVEVTLDPAYDTPARLRAYGRAFDADPARWHLLTGAPQAVYDFAAAFNVSRFDDPSRGLIHNDRTVLVDPQGRINTIVDETGWSPAGIEAQARAMNELPANPIARLDLWLSKGFVAVCGNTVAGSSGLLDLTIMLAIAAAFGWAFYRLGKLLFAASR